jgi:peptidoglycan LD-endopeptidase CwlK
MYKFGNRSRERLDSCHPDIQLIMNEVIKQFDCSIIEGIRTQERQVRLFAEGKTTLDGTTKKSKHQANNGISMAVDVYPYPVNWEDTPSFFFMAGLVKSTAESLYNQGLVAHKIRWGGDWNGNNDFKDQTFDDLPHFELIKSKTNLNY